MHMQNIHPPVPEFGAERGQAGGASCGLHRCRPNQPEEGVMLDAALPQVLAGGLLWCLEAVRANFVLEVRIAMISIQHKYGCSKSKTHIFITDP